MTDDERKMLADLHEAFFKVPPGAGKDAKPLLQKLNVIVLNFDRGSWAVRMFVWICSIIVGLGATIKVVMPWLEK